MAEESRSARWGETPEPPNGTQQGVSHGQGWREQRRLTAEPLGVTRGIILGRTLEQGLKTLCPETWHTPEQRLRLRHRQESIRYKHKGYVGQVGTRFGFDPINATSSAAGFGKALRPFGSLAPPSQTLCPLKDQ
jgi:hypothetical protein